MSNLKTAIARIVKAVKHITKIGSGASMTPEHIDHRKNDKNENCCYGLVRAMERQENNDEKIDKEIEDREKADTAIWKGIDLMRNMVIAGMGSIILAAAVFIGGIFAHAIKVGP